MVIWSCGKFVSSFRKYFTLALAEVLINHARFAYYAAIPGNYILVI